MSHMQHSHWYVRISRNKAYRLLMAVGIGEDNNASSSNMGGNLCIYELASHETMSTTRTASKTVEAHLTKR